jgi:hypothetical protein
MTSMTIDIAICAASSDRCKRAAPRALCPVPARTAPAGPPRPTSHAGTMPKANPVAIATSSANSSTRPSICTASSPGSRSGAMASSAFNMAHASALPSTPAVQERTRLSPSSCRTNRPWPAPSATRTVISRRRAPTSPSCRSATLTQAMSNSRPAAASNNSTGLLAVRA